MKKSVTLLIALLFSIGILNSAQSEDLRVNEKKVYDEFVGTVPKDRIIGIEAFKKVYDEVIAGKRNAYMIDCRTHPEFYAFHIEGSDHIHAGHMYTIPKKIKDLNAEIYLWCRTQHRSFYVAGFLFKYGYKNVHVVKDGIVGWIKAGHPVVNQFAGRFVVTEYHKRFDEKGKYRIREFHPY